MPMLGFGVYQIAKEDCERCVLDAIKVGYRHIDTAQIYGNEEEVGNAIVHCGLPREELFITTKVWLTNYGYEQAKQSVLESLKKLKSEYIDLVLLHQPYGYYYGAYHALQDLYKEKKIRAIGVSNFYPAPLADIASFNEIPPHVNQVEVNPFHQQISAQVNMENRGVVMEAWAPFGEGRNNLFTNPTLQEIGKKYGKSNAQVILRWLLQRGIVSLAKSTHIERMLQNIEIFDFELSQEDMDTIVTLNSGASLFHDHQSVEAIDRYASFVKK